MDAALVLLPKPDRQAIILRFLEGQRLSGVAAELGIGEEAARKRVARALGKLRRLFSREDRLHGGRTLARWVPSRRGAPAGCAAAWANASLTAAPSGWAVLAPSWSRPSSRRRLGSRWEPCFRRRSSARWPRLSIDWDRPPRARRGAKISRRNRCLR
ncbi:MAG: sigma factor-like helix-turn-helix DNA-binding protein [Verrucomicrobiales bacterium]